MSRVFVTGAAGYIGRHVVNQLLELGHEVIASDMNFNGVDERAQRCSIPIFSGAVDIYQQLGKPDVVIHMAWRNGFVHNAPTHMEDLSNHVVFCRNLIEGGLPSLSVMGSMHEVGYWEGAIDENTPCNPLSQYGVAKNALRQEFPFTTGKNLYDFIDVDDLAQMIAKASLQDKVTGIINVCTGKPMSLAERVEKFIQEHGFDIKLKYGAFPDRPYDSPGVWGDTQKIRQIMSNSND